VVCDLVNLFKCVRENIFLRLSGMTSRRLVRIGKSVIRHLLDLKMF